MSDNRCKISIKSDRIVIESVKIEDAYNYYKGFDEEVTRFQFAKPFKTVEEAEDLINNFIKLSYENIDIMLNILDKDRNFIGSIEIYGLYRQYPEIGIWICKDKRKKGYGEEAIKVLRDFFKDKKHIRGFIYEADIRNESSLALIRKLNGIKEGFFIVNDFGKELHLEKYKIPIR